MTRRKKVSVEEKIDLLERFYEENGRLPKQKEELCEGVLTGTFLSSLKGGYVRLSKEQQQRLAKIGIVIMQIGEDEKEYRIQILEKFYEKYKRVPRKSEKINGIDFGTFINHIVRKNISITDAQLKRLEKLGIEIKKTVEERKEEKVCLVEQFYKKNGRLPTLLEKENGISIGIFLNSIKMGNTTITKEQYERLQKLGFHKEYISRKLKKEEKIKLIELFYKQNKRLPNYNEEAENGEKIGYFLICIRRGEVKISSDQLKRLERIGFCFQKRRRTTFDEKLKLMKEFGMEFGRFPRRDEKSKDGVAIGRFFYEVTRGYIKITKEEQEKLRILELEISSIATLRRKKMINDLKKERDLLLNQPEMEEPKMFVKKI